MGSSFGGLSIALSGAWATQRALDITGHNISNVNTPGYSRQTVFNASTQPMDAGYSGNGNKMQLGTGVDVQAIRQYRDELLDAKLRRENCKLGYWGARQESVAELEAIFNDNSEEGLQATINNFWNSWSQLAKPTGGLTARALVKDSAIAFVETVKNMDVMLENYRRNKNTEIMENVDRVNVLSQRIAQLNYDIKGIENAGAYANDYRDERAYLIDELSQMANIQIIDNGKKLSIALEGRLLVNDTVAAEITTVPDRDNSGYAVLKWKSDGAPLELTNGSLKSMLETRDQLVAEYKSLLNELVKGIAAEVNALHFSGYGNLDGTQRNMFVDVNDNTSGNVDLSNIALNEDLIDVNNIAAAELPPPSNYEDNRVALQISELRYKEVFSDSGYEADGKYNYDEFYRNLITSIGLRGQEAATTVEAQKLLVDQIEYRRQAIMNVSLDEEMSNLIRFQHSYNAAARVLNAMDEMLEIIVSRTGIIGR